MTLHSIRRHSSSRRGFALVLSLAIVVLLTLVIVAFFSRATLNRQIAFNGTNSARADQMARSAGDYVLGQLRREMHDGSDVFTDASTDAVYMRPLVPGYILPLSAGVANADTVGQTTIVKVSANPTTAGTGLGKQLIGSGVSISAPSVNGRSIGATRWFGTGGPRLGSADLPTWVYLTRSGVDDPNPLNGADTASPHYVLGRFAYTVYDVSGRLDANIAGYKYSTPASLDMRSPLKTWQAYADLTTMGLGMVETGKLAVWRDGPEATASPDAYYTNLKSAEERGFIGAGTNQNRFLSRHDLIEATSGTGRLSVFGSETLPATLVSSFTHASYCSTQPTWGPTLVSATDPNFISGAGVTATDYRTGASNATSVNRFVPFVLLPANKAGIRHYADDGTYEPVDAQKGDRLVQSRFSLSKLAWIGWNGPDATAFASTLTSAEREEAIRQCFGLEWNSISGKWSYLQFDPASTVLAIKTLAQVAAEGREPNFFEMLNAGILSGSLGQHPGEGPPSSMYSTPVASIPNTYYKMAVNFDKFSGNKARHLLQIGANIIDQYDRDSYPTLIDAVPPSAASGRSDRQQVEDTIAGTENLPYLSRLHKLNYEDPLTSVPNDPNKQNFKYWWLVELWNPHQQWVDTGGPRPTRFRVRAHGNCYSWQRRQNTASTTGQSPNINYDSNPALTDQTTFRDIYFGDTPGSENSWFFNRPRVVRKDDLLSGVSGMETPLINFRPGLGVTYDKFYSTEDTPPTATNYVEFNYAGIFAGEAPYYRNYASSSWRGGFLEVFIVPNPVVTMVVECWDGFRWRPYSSTARIFVSWAGTHNFYVSEYDQGNINLMDGSMDFQSRPAGHAPDPRTDRFSLSKRRAEQGSYWPVEKSVWYAGTTEYSTEENFGGDYPDGSLTSFRYVSTTTNLVPQPLSAPYVTVFTASLMKNLKLDTSPSATINWMYYADPDGVVRPGDGVRMEPGNNTNSTGDGNYLYQFDVSAHKVGRVRRRPVVLNRPFESVAELGYVFRDLPGRNLDLWTKSSPDTGLLDLFSLRQEPALIAGKINLNRAGTAELKSILSGALKARIPPTTSTGATDAAIQQITVAEADKLAVAIRTQLTAGTVEPFGNNAEMALNLAECINNALDGNSTTEKPFKKNKSWAEAPIRSLTQINQNQTWNLLIDVVAQPGRLRKGASSLADYVVEGERRFWLHISMDRATGRVISYQLEPVL